jgi:hypothetical protein
MTITTNYLSPTNIQQVATDDTTIEWQSLYNIIDKGSYASIISPLHTISGLWQERYRTHTNQIWTTGYNFTPLGNTLVGIELSLSTQRLSRVEDLVIQLCLNGELIGLNYALAVPPDIANMYTSDNGIVLTPAGNYGIYGGEFDMWGTSLTIADLANPTFGIVVSFQSHPTIPHRDIASVDQIAIKVYYN